MPILTANPSIDGLGDNVVNLLSQIGWSFTDYNPDSNPQKTIKFDGISINIDSNGGNGTFPDTSNHFHGKNQHRTEVINKVIEYINKQ